MDLEELRKRIETAKLHPVHVEGSPLDDDPRARTFIGDLPEFLEVARVIGTPMVLICTEVLDEGRFTYAPEGEEAGPADEEDEEIDLCAVLPRLSAFRSHIGDVAMYRLALVSPSITLHFFINEDWWLEFIKLWEEATDLVDSNHAAASARSQAARQDKDRQALATLSRLLNDPQFVRLPTQRAMIAYALDQIPELHEVDEFALKSEIQNLNAQIKAKGVGRKR